MLVRPCHGCGKILPPPELKRGNCLECRRELERKRAPRKRAAQRLSERTTAHWERVKAEAKRLAGYECQRCGAAEDGSVGRWLTGHLHPRCGGDHRATVEDVLVLCSSCHGKVKRV
jgi:hypothetical protein